MDGLRGPSSGSRDADATVRETAKLGKGWLAGVGKDWRDTVCRLYDIQAVFN
jgi:hypothetical protein